MDKKKITIIGIVCVIVTLIVGITTCGKKKSDPANYVKVNLDLIFQGDVSQAKEYINASTEELENIYDTGIHVFVDTYLLGDMDVASAYTETYDYLMKEIFAVMRYEVGEAKQIEKNIYEVSVRYQPVDVFTKFIPIIEEESTKIQKALNSGVYGAKKEEAQISALQDYLNVAYEKLEMAYLELQYGAKEEVVMTVKVDNDGNMEVLDNGINQFIELILDLDNL